MSAKIYYFRATSNIVDYLMGANLYGFGSDDYPTADAMHHWLCENCTPTDPDVSLNNLWRYEDLIQAHRAACDELFSRASKGNPQ